MKKPADPVLIQGLFDLLAKANQAGANALLLLADIKCSSPPIAAMQVRVVTLGKHRFRALLTSSQYERITQGKLTLPLLVKRLASLRKVALDAGARFRDGMADYYDARLKLGPQPADGPPPPPPAKICCQYNDTHELLEEGECAGIPDSVQVPLSVCQSS